MTFKRESKDEYYLHIAEAVLRRSTCLRRKYGAVIVKDDEIISTGYNGAPRGWTNCCDLGYCVRLQQNIPHGERYEACRSLHAEANAIISAPRRDMIGSTLYLAGIEADGNPIADIAPCSMCQRLILNAGIKHVVTRNQNGFIHNFYGSMKGGDLHCRGVSKITVCSEGRSGYLCTKI